MRSSFARSIYLIIPALILFIAYTNCSPGSPSTGNTSQSSGNSVTSNGKKTMTHTVNLLMDQQIDSLIDLSSDLGMAFDPATMDAQLVDKDTKGKVTADILLNGKVNLQYTPMVNFFGEDRASILVTDKEMGKPILEVLILLKVNSADSNQLLISGVNLSRAGLWSVIEIKKVGSVDFVKQTTPIAISHLDAQTESIKVYGAFKSEQSYNDLSNLDPQAINSVQTIELTGSDTYYLYFTFIKQGPKRLLFSLADSGGSASLGSHDIYFDHDSNIVGNIVLGPISVEAYKCSGPFRIYLVDKFDNRWLPSCPSCSNYNVIDSSGAFFNNHLFEDATCLKEMPFAADSRYSSKTYSPRFYEFYAKLAVSQFGANAVSSTTLLPSNITFTRCENLDGSDFIKLYFNIGSSPGTKIFSYSTDANVYNAVPATSIKTDYIDLGFLYSGNSAAKIYYFKLVNSSGGNTSTPLIVKVRTADLSGSSILPGSCSVQ